MLFFRFSFSFGSFFVRLVDRVFLSLLVVRLFFENLFGFVSDFHLFHFSFFVVRFYYSILIRFPFFWGRLSVVPGGDHGTMPAEVAGSARSPHLLLPAGCAGLRQGVRAATQAPSGCQQHCLLRCSLTKKGGERGAKAM